MNSTSIKQAPNIIIGIKANVFSLPQKGQGLLYRIQFQESGERFMRETYKKVKNFKNGVTITQAMKRVIVQKLKFR